MLAVLGLAALADTGLQGRFGSVLPEKLALVDEKPATCGVKATRGKVSGVGSRTKRQMATARKKGDTHTRPHSEAKATHPYSRSSGREQENSSYCLRSIPCPDYYDIPDQTRAAFGNLLQPSLKPKMTRTWCVSLSCLPVYARLSV